MALCTRYFVASVAIRHQCCWPLLDGICHCIWRQWRLFGAWRALFAGTNATKPCHAVEDGVSACVLKLNTGIAMFAVI